MIDFKMLRGMFPANKISWRVGATNLDKSGNIKWGDEPQGIPLAYIDARDVMERLDMACEPQNWQCRYPFPGCCEIGIKIGDEWIWKSNGAGETKVEAEKGQYSDAFKRAAVLWGIGQYLYDLSIGYVPIDKRYKNLSKETRADLTRRLDAWQQQYFAKRG